MCGIVGYVGARPCRDLLVAGLEKLEYRGYDSAGVSVIEDGRVDSVRAVGHLGNLRAALEEHDARRRGRRRRAAGDHRRRPHPLGHARPRHRGERPPPQRYLRPRPHRPQRDRREPRQAAPAPRGRGRGVQLRNRRRGRRPPDRQPLRRRPRGGGPRRLRRAARPLRLRRHARRSARDCWSAPARSARWSPASARARASSPRRSPPSSPRPREAVMIENDEIVTIDASGVTITDAEGNPVEREPEEIAWDADAAEKGGYETFMLKEIHEQADAVAETIAGRLPGDEGVDLSEVDLDDEYLRDLKRIVIVACGTSYHAGLVGRYAIEEWARVPVEMDIASEYRYRNPVVGPGDLVIGMTQSGETADTLAAMRLARENGRQGARDHQPDGQPGHPRRRRRPLHAGRARGQRRRDQDLRRPDRRDVPARPAARRAARDARAAERLAELVAELKHLPSKIEETLAPARSAVREVAATHHDQKFFLYLGPPHRPAGLPRGRAEAEGGLLHPDRRLRRRRDEARADRAARRVDPGRLRRDRQPDARQGPLQRRRGARPRRRHDRDRHRGLRPRSPRSPTRRSRSPVRTGSCSRSSRSCPCSCSPTTSPEHSA